MMRIYGAGGFGARGAIKNRAVGGSSVFSLFFTTLFHILIHNQEDIPIDIG
jgi:hypothetical protein